MKKILYLIIFLSAALNVTAQENIFILVDVSLSVKKKQLHDAKQLMKNVLTGKPINSSVFYTVKNFQPKIIPAGSQILIMPLGERNTVMNYNPIIEDVNNESEIISFINKKFPTNPKDNWTYISLAKARLAEIAKKHSIDNYKLIFVSDNISDDFGGRPNYSIYEQKLVDGYNTKNNPVIEKPGVRIKYTHNNAFSVFIQEIDVSGYYPPKASSGPKSQIIPTPLKIVLTTFKGGTNKKPVVLNENNITISWFCKNAPKNAQYKVRVSPINIQGEKSLIHKTTGKSYNVKNLSDGKWRISVYSANAIAFKASSATTTIEINSGGSLWLLWFLLLALIACGGAYWFWNKAQENKLMEITSNQTPNENKFSNQPSTNNPNNQSEYF